MHNTLTNEMQARVRHHVDRISVDTDLDVEIREELYDHFEDRMLEYLSGDEAITEEDAFLLVSDRFGATDRVEAGLRETHDRTPTGTLLRRIGTVLVATIAVEMLLPLGGLPFVFFRMFSQNLRTPKVLGMFLWLLWPLMIAYLLLGVLRHMRGRSRLSENPWYLRLGAGEFILLIAGLLILQQVIPTIQAYFQAVDLLWRDSVDLVYTKNIRGNVIEKAPLMLIDSNAVGDVIPLGLMSLMYFSLQIAAWFWWCDTPLSSVQRRLTIFAAVVAVWTGYIVMVAACIPRANFLMQDEMIETGIGWPHLLFHGRNAFIYNYIFFEWIQGILLLGLTVATTYIVVTTSWRLATRKEQFRLMAIK
jgi:hypothetical protein